MDEKTYIYSRLKFLSEENQELSKCVEKLIDNQKRTLELIDKLTYKIDLISSPEYIKKINEHNQVDDVMKKVKLMKEILKGK